jgi:GntR family transcriptional repressor for pyruvate dehydrogenase complex
MFAPVAQGRISEVIADQIRALVRSGRLGPGDRLPSERDLCQQFGVSRVTVRDALRLLEGAGLIDTRVGARGGAFVRVPTGSQLGEGISDMITMAALHADEVTEARMVLEVGIVGLVCDRAGDEDFDALREICERSAKAVADGHYDVSYSAEFHIRFAKAAHNRALDLLVTTFQVPLRHSLEEARASDPRMGKRGVAEHRALVEAVARRDAEKARAIMSRHLGRTARRVGVPAKKAVGRDPGPGRHDAG